MLEIKHQKTRTVACRENGRSADFTSGNFILGCSHKKNDSYDNPCSYCYVARLGRQKLYVNTNMQEILTECDAAIRELPFPRMPSQIDDTYYYVDIACDTDVNLHWNDYSWLEVFDYFKAHPRLAATFATKWVNTKLLDYEPEKKIRVRMSLMPEKMRSILENGTSPTIKRVQFLEKLFQAGYSTHINFSPIVYHDKKLRGYRELFHIINNEVSEEFKKQCGLECIFLTHNENLHKINLSKGLLDQENILWAIENQEQKISQYGGNNLRYKKNIKPALVRAFTKIVDQDLGIPIRYIF